MSLVGLEDRIIFAMGGKGNQQLVMDMENGRIILTNTVDMHYNWKKLVLDVIKPK